MMVEVVMMVVVVVVIMVVVVMVVDVKQVLPSLVYDYSGRCGEAAVLLDQQTQFLRQVPRHRNATT